MNRNIENKHTFFAMIISVFLLIAVWVILLIYGKISEASLCVLVLLTPIVFVVLFNIERITKLTAETKMGKILFEVEQARQEVEVKAESIKKMVEIFSEFSIRTLTFISGFQSIAQDGVVRIRDRFQELLVEMGMEQSKINEIIQILNDQYTIRIVNRIGNYITHKMMEFNGGKPHPKATEYKQRFTQKILDSGIGREEEIIRQELEAEGFWDDEIGRRLEYLKYFRQTGKLTDEALSDLKN